MPRVEKVEILDDLEYQGGQGTEVPATEVRDFTWDGKNRRTYLSDENAKRFDDLMAEFTEFAEIVVASPRKQAKAASAASTTSPAPARNRNEAADIRAWAETQDFDPPVSANGRIADVIKKAFYAAHPEKAPA